MLSCALSTSRCRRHAIVAAVAMHLRSFHSGLEAADVIPEARRCFSNLLWACSVHRSTSLRHPDFTGVPQSTIRHCPSFLPLLPPRWGLYRAHFSLSSISSPSLVALATQSVVPSNSSEESGRAPPPYTAFSPSSPLAHEAMCMKPSWNPLAVGIRSCGQFC